MSENDKPKQSDRIMAFDHMPPELAAALKKQKNPDPQIVVVKSISDIKTNKVIKPDTKNKK